MPNQLPIGTLGLIRNELISSIKTAYPIIDIVDKYRGEFTDNGEGVSASTAVLIQVIHGYEKFIDAADDTQLRTKAMFKIYCGGNARHDKDGLDVCEAVINLLNKANITVTVGEDEKQFYMTISPEGFDTIYFEKDFEAYAFYLLII